MSANSIALTLLIFSVLKPTLSSDLSGSTYCDFYSEKKCRDSPESCPTREKCILDHPASRNHCFVTWHFDRTTNKTTVKEKGCFLDGSQCYDKSECADTNGARRRNIFFCCCSGDMCNKNFSWNPSKPTDTEEIASSRFDQTEQKESAPKIVRVQEEGPSELPLQDNVQIDESWQRIALNGELQAQETTRKANETKAEEPDNWAQGNMTIIVSLAASLCIAIALGTVYWWLNRRNSLKLASAIRGPNSKVSLSPYLGPIDLLDMKARGTFGTIWKARMANQVVAAKIMSTEQKQSWLTEQEVFRLPQMNHRDLLAFIGAEKRDDNLITELWLVTEYHEKGSLGNYLKENVLTWREMGTIAESILRGLAHLHDELPGDPATGSKPAVAHRDLKSQNILIKADMTACIADFGLSLIFHPNKPTGNAHNRVGTRRYMAPEVLQGAINFNRDAFLKIDMYACGLVLWELASRCVAQNVPVEKYRLPFETEVGLSPTIDDMLKTVIAEGQRPEIMETWRKHPGLGPLCETIEECWDTDPESRPSASCALERIASINKLEIESEATKIWIEEDPVPICAKEVFNDMRNAALANK